MEPRLPSSKKWTAYPKELLGQVQGAFAESFKKEAKNGKFILDGRIYGKEITLSVGFLEKGRLRQINFDVSVDFDIKKTNALKMIHLCVDSCASLFAQYFEAQDTTEFPVQWQEFDVDGTKVFARFHAVNTDLEKQANSLLGEEEEDAMLAGEDEDEVRAQVAAMLGLDEAEEDKK